MGLGDASFTVFGWETGESGTLHLQGYTELPNRLRLAAIRELFGPRVHAEKRKGSQRQASEYCTKEGNYERYGICTSIVSGQRTDLEQLHTDLKLKRSIESISDEHFSAFIKYRRSIEAYIGLHSDKRNWITEVIVLWGATGTGKTRRVYEDNENVWSYPGSGWFDGYRGNDVVLFDDFSGSEFKIGYLLKLLDRYPMDVPIKGGFVNWKPQKIYITSNLNPALWYSGAYPEHQLALQRRFTTIEEYK